jgi:pimeloyl-ACP methyl ester carboxylesterase
VLSFSKYLNESSDQWVTFIHGAGGSSTIWYKQIRDFKEHYNLLFIDLRGHGKSKLDSNVNYTFSMVTNDVIEVLDHLKISSSHFIGISLGTILIRNIVETRPELVKSMVLGGAIFKLNLRSQILMHLGIALKSILPYMFLYKFFAYIIMPRRNHRDSRNLFVKEARKLRQNEFIKWFKLTSEINPLLKRFRNDKIETPSLYIMGEQDHLFLPSIKKLTDSHVNSSLYIVPKCGHVVNVEQAELFNQESIGFISY